MNISDHIINFLLAVLLHALGLLAIGTRVMQNAAEDALLPRLEVSSVELSLAEVETDSPSSSDANTGSPTPASEPLPPPVPAVPLPPPVPVELAQPPAPAEPAPPEELPERNDLTATFAPPPLPPLEPQPSLIVLPTPEPPRASAQTASSTPSPVPVPAGSSAPQATRQPILSGGDAHHSQATLQPDGNGGGTYGRVDAHPSLERTIKPHYPIGSRRRGEEGTVILDVTVSADGRVSNTALVTSSGFAELDRAAENAATQARFKPGTRDDKPVASAARLTLIFRLRDA